MGKRKKGILIIIALLIGIGIFFYLFKYNHEEKKKEFLNAVVNGDLDQVENLLAQDPSLTSLRDGRGKGGIGSTVLYLAVNHGHKDIAELLLSRGANPNEIRFGGPLHQAAMNGDAEFIELLIKYGADLDITGEHFYSYPPLACVKSREAAEALIANGADLNWKTGSGGTILHSLVRRGTPDAVAVILEHGVDINARDKSGSTALHEVAFYSRNKEMTELLIAKGANIDIKNKKGLTPLQYSLERITVSSKPPKGFAETLISHGAKFTISDVVWLGDTIRVNELIESDPDLVNYMGGSNREPVIFTSIYAGNRDIFSLLIEKGAMLDVKGIYGESALTAASLIGNTSIIKILLEKGVDVNERGLYGESALHWAAVKGNTEAVRLLLEGGADVTIKADEPVLDLDARAGNYPDAIERMLINHEKFEEQRLAQLVGRSLQICVVSRLAFAEGDTPLHSAAQWGHEVVVKLLLDNGAKVDAENNFGQRPLQYACVCRHKDIVQILLDSGSDIEAKDKNGHTPLRLASTPQTNPAEEIVKLLREKYTKE